MLLTLLPPVVRLFSQLTLMRRQLLLLIAEIRAAATVADCEAAVLPLHRHAGLPTSLLPFAALQQGSCC